MLQWLIRRNNQLPIATWIIVSDTSMCCSQSRTRRRHRISQPKVLSTTHLRDSMLNPGSVWIRGTTLMTSSGPLCAQTVHDPASGQCCGWYKKASDVRSAETTNTPFARAGSLSEASAPARHVADRFDNLAQVYARLALTLGRFQQQWLYLLSFFIREIARVTLRLPLNPGPPASRLSYPH